MSEKRENEIPRISWVSWALILIISLAAGGFLHWGITAGVYHAASVAAATTPASFARNWGGIGQGGSTPDKISAPLPAAEFVLRYVGLSTDSVDRSLAKRLESAYQPVRANFGDKATSGKDWVPPERTPALVVAARILGPGDSTNCDERIIEYIASALGRQLLGWPGDTSAELSSIKQFRQARTAEPSNALSRDEPPSTVTSPGAPKSAAEGVRKQVEAACNKFEAASPPDIKWLGPTLSRSEPKSGEDLAELILGTNACLPGGASTLEFTECRLVKTLFAAAINADSIRNVRLKINFWWGWERAAVAALVILVLLSMGYLHVKRKPLEEQEKWLRTWLEEADRRLSPNKPGSPTTDPEGEAGNMHQQFHNRFGRSPNQMPPYEWKGGLTVLRDLVDATQESLKTPHRAHLEKFVELHTQALARQRAFINALITAFPAIGLVATLEGLIKALSRASGIVSGTDAERFASTEFVTGVLSSSFATTMLALIAMAACMVLNVREEHREADLLENTHKRLIAVFWPGRPASTQNPRA